jgi:hypothetical protein
MMDPEDGQEPPSKKAKLENDGTQEGHDHAVHFTPLEAPGAAVPNGLAPLNSNGDTHEATAPSEANPIDPAAQPPAPNGGDTTTGAEAPPAAPNNNTAQIPTKPEPVITVAPQAIPLDTYCTREIRHIDRETSGELRALYVHNDGAPDSGRFLIGLKNIFSKCLPNMPKTYITRLVFDRRHRSVVIVKVIK